MSGLVRICSCARAWCGAADVALRVSATLLRDTLDCMRQCGAGRCECQTLWVGPWSDPDRVTRLVHPEHSASPVGFQLDSGWLTGFWSELARQGEGVRCQIHTHPGHAYHSATDDAFPLLSLPGFLSLVIPRFAQGPATLENAFLAQIGHDARWREVAIDDHIKLETI